MFREAIAYQHLIHTLNGSFEALDQYSMYGFDLTHALFLVEEGVLRCSLSKQLINSFGVAMQPQNVVWSIV